MTSLNFRIGIGGLYQLETQRVLKRDDYGNPVELSEPEVIVPWYHNNITAVGLDMLGSGDGGDKLAYCRIGTGNTAPADTDVGLAAQVGYAITAGANHNTVGLALDGSYIYRRVVKQFAAGSINGLNLAEVAFAPQSTGNVFSRELIRDAGGNPITITLDGDEILSVLYELRYYLPANDATVAATIDGSPNTVTIRYCKLEAQLLRFAPSIGIPFSLRRDIYNEYSMQGVARESNTLPSASVGWNYSTPVPSTITYPTYVAGSYTKKATLNYAIGDANFATGIGSIFVGHLESGGDSRYDINWPAVGYAFATKLNKTSARKATVTISISWAKHT